MRTALLVLTLAFGIGCTKQPTDSQITQQIQSKFGQDSGLQAKSITVQTTGGVVTLSGTVDNDTERTAAAHYASTVPGIKEVVNNLEVAAAAPPAPVTNLTAEATPPPAKSAAKPRPSTPRARPKKQMATQDSPDWDAPPSDSNAGNDTSINGGAQMASATPASTTPAVATPPPPPPPKKLTIPSGTTIAIRLVDTIDSETAQQGQTFKATLDSPLAAEGEVAIPTGYKVEGHVVSVQSAGKFAGQSLLVLQLDRVSVGGKSYNLQTDQYKREGSSRSKNTVEKVGAGAVIGAIIGGIAGGGKGAGIGAAAGGGLGGGVQAATKGQQIKLPSETVLNFTLMSPVTVTPVEGGPDATRPKLDTPQ